MARTILVSNRLPVTARVENGELKVERSVGGLTTALSASKRSGRALWIGWPGPVSEIPRPLRNQLESRLAAIDCVPVALTSREIREYYEEVSNGILWPLLHYQADRVPLAPKHWGTYAAVNSRFADAVAQHWQKGDDIWVHDYQLLLVPALLRQRLPLARIGFFLHIPFPALEVFRILPWRSEVLEGMLGADLVGFHTRSYARHFRDAALALTRATEAREPDQLRFAGRNVHVGAYPIGIDAREFERRANQPDVDQLVSHLKTPDGIRLIAGVDRLDYTKGIPHRLLAFQRLLEDDPELRGAVRLIQVVVPSRTGVRSYREFRTELEALIGHINGTFGTPSWTPVTYQYRALDRSELLALYRAADVMFVTPVRDGMNLVAKEYVAVRSDVDGVLVLSEFAGAAEDLQEALQVNPFNVERTARSLEQALAMSPEQQRVRMAALRRRVFAADAARWANRFLTRLHAVRSDRDTNEVEVPLSTDDELAQLARRIQRAPSRLFLLDYDGTLVRFTNAPAEARPDARLLDLLERMAQMPDTEVHVVSGRSHESLDEWLGHLDVGLHAEHGLWSRPPHATRWKRQRVERSASYDEFMRRLGEHAQRAPGALVEEKSAGLAWHYRMANERLGAREAARLIRELTPLAKRHGLEVLPGNKVVEIRPATVNKGVIVSSVAASLPKEAAIVAMGDDRTDEDLFAALPPGGIAVHVGPTPSRARYRVRDVRAARAWLERVVDGQRSTIIGQQPHADH
jgi:trehalose 6-phosphate synthase/phosphatase